MRYNATFKEEIIKFANENAHLSYREIAEIYDVSERSVRRWIEEVDIDEELVKENIKLARSKQKAMDTSRIERKAWREHARKFNAVNEFGKELLERFTDNNLSSLTTKHRETENEVVGILQLSDIHFNEQINLDHNKYNFNIAAKRLRKFVNKARKIFDSQDVSSVVVAMTGDLLNSDRRLDELLENATNRSKATMIAVDIIQQIILDLNADYNVTVASVCGNESRVNKDIGWIDQIASDSYDFVIHHCLLKLFEGSEGVVFHDMHDPLEHILEVNNKKILLIHGHNGISTNNNIEGGVSKTISRYATRGVQIDYVLMGHIHNSNIGDFYARSSGLPGSNAYSEKALNLYSGASQNIFLVSKDSIDGMRICLQECEDYEPYNYNANLEAYHSKSENKANELNQITIHKVVI